MGTGVLARCIRFKCVSLFPLTPKLNTSQNQMNTRDLLESTDNTAAQTRRYEGGVKCLPLRKTQGRVGVPSMPQHRTS